jgi:hypothetical protein
MGLTNNIVAEFLAFVKSPFFVPYVQILWHDRLQRRARRWSEPGHIPGACKCHNARLHIGVEPVTDLGRLDLFWIFTIDNSV